MKKLNIRKKYSDAKHTGIEYIKEGQGKVNYIGSPSYAPLIMKIAPNIEVSTGIFSKVVSLVDDGIVEFKDRTKGCHLYIDWGDGMVENRMDLPQNFSHEYDNSWKVTDTVDIKVYCFDKTIKTVFNWEGDTEKKIKRIKDIISWGNLGYSKLPSFTNLQIQTEYFLNFPADTFKGFENITEFDEELYLYNATIDPDFWKYVPTSGKVKKLIYGRGTLDFTTLFKNITGKFPNLETVERLLLGSLPGDIEDIESVVDFMAQAADFLEIQTKLVNCPSFFYTEKPDVPNTSGHQTHAINIPDSIANKSFENMYNFFGGGNVFKFNDKNIPDYFLANSPNLKNISYLFNKQDNITKLPEGIFTNKPHLRDLSYASSECKELVSLPESLKTLNWGGDEKNPGVNMMRAFNKCEHLEGIAPELWSLTSDTTGTKIIDGLNCFRGCERLENYNDIPEYWTSGNNNTPVIRSLKINGSEDLIVNCPDTTVKVNYDIYSGPNKIIKYWIGTDKENLSEVTVNWELGEEDVSLSGYVNYTLQWMEAPQTLYFKAASELGESEIYARQVSVPTKDWRLDSIKLAGIENFSGIYDSENISIIPNIVGSKAIPQRYMLSLDAAFTGAEWKKWDGQNISYTLPYVNEGDKFTVYLKMDDDYSYVSDVRSLEIQINKYPILLNAPTIVSYHHTEKVGEKTIYCSTSKAISIELDLELTHLHSNPLVGWLTTNSLDDTNFNIGTPTLKPGTTNTYVFPYSIKSKNTSENIYIKLKNNNGVVSSKDELLARYYFVVLNPEIFKISPEASECTTHRDIELMCTQDLTNSGISHILIEEETDADFTGAEWKEWDGDSLVPFTLSPYGTFSKNTHGLKIKVKNLEGQESNITNLAVLFGWVADGEHLHDSDFYTTTSTVTEDFIDIPFTFKAATNVFSLPNECYLLVGEDSDFTGATWYKIPAEECFDNEYGANGTYRYTFLNQEDGEKTLYVKRRINDISPIVELSVKKVIKSTPTPPPPVDYDIETVNLSFVAPEGTNPEDINLSFPKLKYNKKIVFSWINDDAYAIWNNIFSPVNRKYVSSEKGINPWSGGNIDFFYHDGIQREINQSTGYIPSKPLEYSDGCGVRHRFTSSVAMWPEKMFLPEAPDDPDKIVGYSWMWTSAREAKKLADFGYTLLWHDVFADGDTESQEMFDQRLTEKTAIFQKAYGKTPKSLAEPNGNHKYLDYCQENSLIQFVTAQSGDGRIKEVYPYSDSFSLDKSDVTVQRIFAAGTNEEYINRLITKLQEAYDSTDLTTIPWVIGSGHRCSSELDTVLFTQIEEKFGVSGNDSIWVPSVDEFYEYWYMTKGTKISKTIEGQNVNFKLEIPVKDNFWFKNLSCLVDGLSNTDGIQDSSDCDVFSYGMSDGKVLINFGWGGTTYEIANQYVNNAMLSFRAGDYEDALYFSQLIKPQLKEQCVKVLKQVWNEGYTHDIIGLYVNGDHDTGDITVTNPKIQVSTSEANMMKFDWLMVSEEPTFTESTGWIPTDSGTEYTLIGSGEHTLYIKVKDDLGVESNVLSRKVILNIPPILFNRIYGIPTAATTTPSTTIRLDYKAVNEGGSELAYYRLALGKSASDTTISDDVPWIKFGKATKDVVITFPEGEELGEKYVLAQVKDIYEQVSEVKSTTIRYEAPLTITKFMVNSSSESSVSTYCRSLSFDCESNYPVNYYYISYNADYSNRVQVKDSTNFVTFNLPDEGTEFTIYPQAVRDGQVVNLPGVTVTVEEAPVNSKIVLANVNADANYIDDETIGRVNKQILRNITKENWVYNTEGKLCCINTGQWQNNSNFTGLLAKFYTKWDKEYGNYGNAIYWKRPTFATENSGDYPDSFILGEKNDQHPSLIFNALKQGRVNEKRFPGIFLRNLNPGTYKVRLLLSHGRASNDIKAGAYDLRSLHYYQVNDQVINPPDVSIYLNNNTQWLEFENVTVDNDGLMMIGYYLQFPEDTAANLDILSTIPFPIIEIIKK